MNIYSEQYNPDTKKKPRISISISMEISVENAFFAALFPVNFLFDNISRDILILMDVNQLFSN